jgi:hypothetical protein
MFVTQGLEEALARGRRVSPRNNRLDPKHIGSPRILPQETRSRKREDRREDMTTFFVNGGEQVKAPSN